MDDCVSANAYRLVDEYEYIPKISLAFHFIQGQTNVK